VPMRRNHIYGGAVLTVTLCALLVPLSVSGRSGPKDVLKSETGKVHLQIKLKKGQAVSIKTDLDQVISQEINGKKQDVHQNMLMEYRYEIVNVDSEGELTVKVTYTRVHFKQEDPAGVVEYDSADPPAIIPDTALGHAALVGQHFSAKLMPDGRVTGIEGADAMIANMLEKIDIPDRELKAQIENSLKAQFGNAGLKETMESTLAVYPKKPVALGATWSKKVVLSTSLPVTVETTYTLKSRSSGLSKVDLKGRIASNPDSPPIQMGGIKLSYELSGVKTGTVEIDERTGLATRAQLHQDLSGTINAPPGPRIPEGISWPVSIKGTMILQASANGR
ncbi:DUF6263 family protein, partial [Acidobacteriota bacterium]